MLPPLCLTGFKVDYRKLFWRVHLLFFEIQIYLILFGLEWNYFSGGSFLIFVISMIYSKVLLFAGGFNTYLKICQTITNIFQVIFVYWIV